VRGTQAASRSAQEFKGEVGVLVAPCELSNSYDLLLGRPFMSVHGMVTTHHMHGGATIVLTARDGNKTTIDVEAEDEHVALEAGGVAACGRDPGAQRCTADEIQGAQGAASAEQGEAATARSETRQTTKREGAGFIHLLGRVDKAEAVKAEIAREEEEARAAAARARQDLEERNNGDAREDAASAHSAAATRMGATMATSAQASAAAAAAAGAQGGTAAAATQTASDSTSWAKEEAILGREEEGKELDDKQRARAAGASAANYTLLARARGDDGEESERAERPRKTLLGWFDKNWAVNPDDKDGRGGALMGTIRHPGGQGGCM